jgi:photosystem II stability/assembly factor-like uncharacterized protein
MRFPHLFEKCRPFNFSADDAATMPRRSFQKRLVIVLILVLIPFCASRLTSSFFTAAAQGQEISVSMTGPFGGDVTSLAEDPFDSEHVLIGTHDGQIFRSQDGGETWSRVRPGLRLGGFEVKRFHFDRERKGVIYAGLAQIRETRDENNGGGLYRSADGGSTWTQLSLRGGTVRNIAQSVSDANVLVVVTKDAVWHSADRGENWRRITPTDDPELRNFHSVAIDPRESKRIYAGTSHLPWKTLDGGQTWTRAGSKETGMIDDSDIFAIQINEANPDNVLMSACSGIYSSRDATAKWTKIQGIPYTSRRTHVIYQHPSKPEVIFAGTTEGLWLTTDGGTNWNLKTSRKLIINAIAIHPDKPSRVLVGTEDMGVLISSDGGETYEISNAGFISRQIRTITADRTERNRIYAGVIFDSAGGGFFISEDGGITWQQSNNGMGVRDIYAIHQDQKNPAVLYAGTNYGLFRSDDRGKNWRTVATEKSAPTDLKKQSQITAASGESAAAASAKNSPAGKTGVRPTPVVQSRPSQTQTKAAPKKPAPKTPVEPKKPETMDLQNQVFALAPIYPRTEADAGGLVAATWDGIYRTTDEKKGWKRLLLHPSDAQRSGPIVRAVATSQQMPGLIFAGTDEGLFISRDNGESFVSVPMDGEVRRVQSIVLDPRLAETVYVGASNAFFRSTDGGKTWERRGSGLRLASSVSAITLNPENPDEVFVGDYNLGGLFRSVDRGRNWEMIDIDLLPSTRLWTLAADPFDHSKVYAGSFSGGVYVMSRN